MQILGEIKHTMLHYSYYFLKTTKKLHNTKKPFTESNSKTQQFFILLCFGASRLRNSLSVVGGD
jgi:hypothetical protein